MNAKKMSKKKRMFSKLCFYKEDMPVFGSADTGNIFFFSLNHLLKNKRIFEYFFSKKNNFFYRIKNLR